MKYDSLITLRESEFEKLQKLQAENAELKRKLEIAIKNFKKIKAHVEKPVGGLVFKTTSSVLATRALKILTSEG